MKQVQKIAIKTPTGKVKTAPVGKHHRDIPHAKGQHGFIVDGKFTGRKEAAKVAAKSGQSKSPVKSLHSKNLKGARA
jgi:hypothetical protein